MQTETKISTSRLTLRTWQPSDIPLMAAISADPQVMEFFPAIQDYAATEKLYAAVVAHQKEHGYSLYATETKDSQEFIGFVVLFHPWFIIPGFVSKGLPIIEIGWRLAARHWGKGYATEAASAVLKYAFMELDLNEIISFTASVNIRSRHVMEKIGLKHNARNDFDHPSLSHDSILKRHVLYRLTRNEFINP